MYLRLLISGVSIVFVAIVVFVFVVVAVIIVDVTLTVLNTCRSSIDLSVFPACH